MYQIEVDRDKCEGCGECAEACPGSVPGMVDGKADVVGSADVSWL
ncbi:MAG: ferredoxin [Bacillota bacterium]